MHVGRTKARLPDLRIANNPQTAVSGRQAASGKDNAQSRALKNRIWPTQQYY